MLEACEDRRQPTLLQAAWCNALRFCLPCCNCAGDLALLYESWWKTRRSIIWTIAPDRREEEKKVLFDRSGGLVPLLLAGSASAALAKQPHKGAARFT